MRYKIAEHGLNWQVASAGTENYHVGEAPHVLSQKVCREHNIDISAQRAQKFTKNHFAQYDLIYAMATDVLSEMKDILGVDGNSPKVILFMNELNPGSNKSVPDPYYGNEDGYHKVYDMIDTCCDVIIEKYKR